MRIEKIVGKTVLEWQRAASAVSSLLLACWRQGINEKSKSKRKCGTRRSEIE